MASIAKFSVAPKVAAARHGRFAGSRVSKVRAPTRDSASHDVATFSDRDA